ncbi:hypothetical protein OOK58_26570 [Streptomyces sp. NBC_01728]|uniref:hypothetical protein n=1 Tax=unclassified Streptomyces TaxID=2593676 RepID=UPI002252E1CE|nr:MULTISPECIES: hypothetical protein [unclassified Streptomyces]MCX4455556.1 hypothetical protein [Streptomyces sp. NBC_01719]MCX4494916.1 hypothetical protein [Streptomyces sp. NBC_01728]
MPALISSSRPLLLPPPAGAAPVRGPVGTAAAAVDVRQEASSERDAVLRPLLDVLSAVAARGGRLDAAEAAGYARALETANASLERRRKERTEAGVTVPVPVAVAVAVSVSVSVVDPVSDLLAQLQSTVDGLVKALTGTLGTVTGLLSPVVGVVTGLLGGGLSTLPALPTAGSPATPPR